MRDFHPCRILFFLGLFLHLSGLSGNCQTADPVSVNILQPNLTAGDQLSLRAAVNAATDQDVDLYFVLSIPGIPFLFFMGPDLLLGTEPLPLATNFRPFAIPEVSVLEYTLTGFEPEGEYLWAGAAFRSGGPINGESLVGNISIAAFQVTAPAILDWFPRHGEVLQTTQPDLSVLFKRPVNRGSVVQHMEIKVESLTSGKIAEVKWINGERWLYLVLPGVGTLMQRVSGSEYISPLWTEEDRRLMLHVASYTIYGSTYSLHYGGAYRLTFNLLQGALFADGSQIPPRTIGPIDFTITQP